MTHRGFSPITIDRSTTHAHRISKYYYPILTVSILIDALNLLSHAPRSEQTVVAEALK